MLGACWPQAGWGPRADNRQGAGEEASGSARLVLTLLPFPPVHAPHPPLSVVCRFAHLLNQSQEDFLAEAELLKLQEEVVRKIRSNQQLQQDLNLMDIKIGLLVKNRITLQVRGRALLPRPATPGEVGLTVCRLLRMLSTCPDRTIWIGSLLQRSPALRRSVGTGDRRQKPGCEM